MLHAITRGEGEVPVLLVHGFLGTSRNLQSLGRRLAEANSAWRVVIPDLRGHGGSPPLPAQPDLNALADDIVQLARAQPGTTPPHIVGHSLGGRVALAALAMAPDAFDHAVLLDIAPTHLASLTGPMQRVFERLMGAPSHAPSRAAMRTFFLQGEVDEGLTDWVLTNLEVAESGEVRWRFDRAALARLHWQEGAESLWPTVQTHSGRIWCIAGGRSAFVSPDDQQRLVQLGARLDVIPQAGHFLHVDAQSELVALLCGADSALRSAS